MWCERPHFLNRKGREVGAQIARAGPEVEVNAFSNAVIGAALTVHTALGPRLLGTTYAVCLKRELDLRGIRAESQVSLPLIHMGVECDVGYELELLIGMKLVAEIKAVEDLTNVHLAQILPYLKLTDCRLGLLIKFNMARLKAGIRRGVTDYQE